MIPSFGTDSKRKGYTLLYGGVHANKYFAQRGVLAWKGRKGCRTKVQERDVRSDGVRMILWCATAWRKD